MIDTDEKDLDGSHFPDVYNGFNYLQVAAKVRLLDKLAKALHLKRKRNGFLRLDQIKVQYHLNSETGLPTGFSTYERTASHR